ncbi:MAG: ral nucleoside transport system ATP-binding protein [Thermoanaerobaculia bacterium]|jgi:simple sugar transport system ATP-binding protein|nr:ral nucleoside transport system ATP-binding protein [Thermoanaerobaculia bacterium]
MRLNHITKRFGANLAVDDVSLTFVPGEIVGLVGENGAGKTTLMSIAAGELAADEGTIEEPSPAGIVHQHFLLVSEFTIAENLALTMWGRDPESIIRESGIELRDVKRRVADLSVGEKAKLELIKAVARHPRFLILDEPTSVLAPVEATELFAVMRRLAAAGTTVVFISHKIAEVLEVATRVVVMRRGKIVADGAGMPAAELAEAMVERRQIEQRERRSDSPVRQTSGISRTGESDLRLPDARLPALQLDDGVAVHAGEIVAIIGVAGNGQSELATSLRDSLRGPVAHIPEDRARDGLIAEMTIGENIALAEPHWRPRLAAQRAAALIERFNIRAQSPQQRAGSLSGGNQQKVILARELERKPNIIIAAEPSRGLDIESTRFVHDELRAAAARGAAILLITSDLDEAFALGDAVHVIYRGKLSTRLTPAEAAEKAPALMAGIA